jgi:hypothetical protein
LPFVLNMFERPPTKLQHFLTVLSGTQSDSVTTLSFGQRIFDQEREEYIERPSGPLSCLFTISLRFKPVHL